MNKLMAWVLAGCVGLSLVGASFEAEAKKRFGGGNNVGTQREAVQPSRPAAPPQAQGQPGAGVPAAAPAAAGAAGRSMPGWLGPVAGLLAGGALAALFFGGAFNGLNFGDIMLFIALAIGAVMVMRMIRARAQPPVSYRMSNGESAPGTLPASGAAPAMPVPAAVAEGRIPAGFDVQDFVRNAKTSFIRLQAANDAKDLNDIREYTTPQVYAAVAMQMQERGDIAQRTEVVSINAQVMQVVTEGEKMIASVRFTGLIREDDAVNPEPVDEIWHVEKALNERNAAWLIAGIQQVEESV